MNILIFIAGVSVGWAADKLYQSYIANKKDASEEKDVFEVEEVITEEASVAEAPVTKNESTKEDVEKEKTQTEENETEEVSSEERHDDLSQLKGVGPKLVEALNEIGIYSYEQLSEPSIDILLEKLRETGGRFSRPVISAVMERAKQAAKER